MAEDKKKKKKKKEIYIYIYIRQRPSKGSIRIPQQGSYLVTIHIVSILPISRFPLTSRPIKKKSRIRETSNLSTDADRRTDTILERLRDLSILEHPHAWAMDALHPPLVFRAPRVGDGRSAPTPRF